MEHLHSILVGALIGAIGGAVGAAIGHLLSKRFPARWVMTACVLLGVAISGPLGNDLFGNRLSAAYASSSTRQEVVNDILQDLEEKRVFGVIFRIYPEAREEIRSGLNKAVASGDKVQAYALGQAVASQVVSRYFNQHLSTAPDDVLQRLLERNAAVLEELKSEPELCVVYFDGNPSYEQMSKLQKYLEGDIDIKADVIEASIRNPVKSSTPLDPEALINGMITTYQRLGYDLETLVALEDVTKVDPETGCLASRNFSNAILSYGDEAPAVFRALNSMSQ